MSVVLERIVQEIRQGNWDEFEVIEKKFDGIEKKCGYRSQFHLASDIKKKPE
jgi:hypothetical protein